MQRILIRGAQLVGGLVLLLVVTVVVVAETRWDRTFEAPMPALRASSDPATIARGRYLAYGPAHCVACHATRDGAPSQLPDQLLPLAGGRPLPLPGGTAHAPNITNDSATGIGRLSDAQLARALRHGVRHDGRVLLPYMAFTALADDDLVALLSYLRAAPPVRHEVAPHEYGLVTRAILAMLLAPPKSASVPPAVAPTGPGLARGEYLVQGVAGCASCHSLRDKVGGYVGPRLAGGLEMESESDPRERFVTPNLTPDRTTGRIATWSAEQFIARVRAGRVHAGSPMPWEAYARMSDDDLRAIHGYLHSLAPVDNPTGASRRRVP